MGNAFFWNQAQSASPADQLKNTRKELSRAIRALDRERIVIQRKEVLLQQDIKRAAKQGKREEARMLVRDLVIRRKNAQKLLAVRMKIQSLDGKIQNAQNTAIMADAMKRAVGAMWRINQQMNVPQIQAILREYDKQEMNMEIKQGMMDDFMEEDGLEKEDEAEMEQMMQQVLDEIGIDLTNNLGDPNEALLQRLEQLRK